MSGARHHTAGRARLGLVPLLVSLLALGAHGQLLSVPYGDQGVAVEHGLGIAPGTFGGMGSVDWLAHGDLAEGEVLRLHASSETARLGPAVDPDLAYAGRQGWLSLCRETGRWRLGVRLRAADLGLSAREVDFGVGSRGGTVSLATLLGDGWYGALGHGWGRPEPQATWPGSRITGSGGGQFWALDLGRRTRRYTTGVRLEWSASGQRIEGRASGLRPDAPAGWTTRSLWGYRYRTDGAGARGWMVVSGRAAGSLDLDTIAGNTVARLEGSARGAGVLAFRRERRGRTCTAWEVGAGWLWTDARGAAATTFLPGISGGLYRGAGDLAGPWLHISMGARRELGGSLSAMAGVRLDGAWPRGRITLTEDPSLGRPGRTVYDLGLRGEGSYLLTPALGLAVDTGRLSLDYSISLPLPILHDYGQGAGDGGRAGRTDRPPVRHEIRATYSF